MKLRTRIALSVLILATYALSQSVAGWTLTSASSPTGCVSSTSNALCVVSTTPPSLQAQLNGGAWVQIYPTTAPTMSFSQVTGQLSGSQMPASTTCTFSASVGTSNTVTISACK